MSRFIVIAMVIAGLTTTMACGPAEAADLCGRVWSGEHAIVGARILASAEGVLATTDSTGRFCLTSLRAETQRVQVIALGYERTERLIRLGDKSSGIHFELIPLRTLGAGVGGAAMRGAAAQPPADKQPARQKPTGPRFLELAEDRIWLAREPADAFGDSLLLLHATLTRADSLIPPENPSGYWRAVAAWADRFWSRRCGPKSTSETASFTCSFLERARVFAEVRAVFHGDRAFLQYARGLVEQIGAVTDSRIVSWAKNLQAVLDGNDPGERR